ncbi:tape measure protein [Cupriavidus necator]|uniref:tape measure protein n=1 Tax=Cupriavidus necator TaxID=106590 RepID=UPI00339D7351
MADNNRDVSLQVTASTVGAESIRNLAKDVHDLAKQGGDAAPEFQRLATELDKLATQQDAIDQFTALKEAVESLATDQVKAKDAAAVLGKELTDLSGSTAKFKESEDQAKQAVLDAQRALAEKREELARLKLNYDEAGKTNADYKEQVRELSNAILDARAALREKKDALQAAKQATRDAAEAEQQLGAQAKLADAEVRASTTALTRRTAALNESKEALQAAGVATEDMVAAQGALGRAFAETVGAIEQQQAAIVATRQAQAEAAERAKAAMAEEDRLTSLQINNRYRLEAAAREQLEAERRQYAESAALAKQAAEAKIAAEQRYVAFQKSAAEARKALDDAFAVTGVRSAQSVRTEIDRINSALHALANDASVSGAEFDRAFASGQRRIGELKKSLDDTADAANKTSLASRLVSSAFGQLTAAYGGFELAKRFLDANVQLESMRRTLAITNGSIKEAGRQIEFLRDTANRSGIAVGEISESYKRFSVSMQQAGISASTTETVFAAITRTTGLMGQGSERAALALEALSQMAGKGCHAPGTLIRLADGSARVVEKIAVGDALMGPDGEPRTVMMLAHGVEEMFRVTPDVGEPFVVNLHHRMRVIDGVTARTMEVIDYLALAPNERNTLSLVHANLRAVPFHVQSVGDGEFHGFLISGDHLYLDAQGFEHHNTVSMEELRQQLGDSVPGAMKIAADGMGLTVKQLTKMVEAGQIMAADMLPALADQLTKTIAKGTEQVEGFGASWARFKNLMTEASTTIGDTGALNVLTLALRTAGVVAGSVAMGVSTTLDVVFTAVKQLATLTAGVVHGDLKGAVAESGVLFDQMIDRQAKLGRAIEAMAGAGEQSAASQRSVGVAAEQAGSQAQAATGGVNANAQAHGAAAAAANGNAQAQQGAGAAAAAAGTQAAGATQGWYAIQAAYIDVNKTAEQNTLIAEKLAQAKKHEGEASVSLAHIGGNEIEMRQAAVRAAQGDEQALRTLANARQQEVIYLKAQAESLIIAAGGSAKLRDDQKEQIKTLNDLIDKKTAEAERSKVAADSAQVETVARRAAAETYKDNASRLAELKAAAESAAAELARMKSQEVDNSESHAAVAKAAQDAAYAEGLYRDALSDTAAAAERKIAVLRENAFETDVATRASLAFYKTQEQEAQMYGRTAEAQEYQIRQKQLQIQTVRDHIAAVEQETKAIIAQAEADRAAAEASGQLNPAKQQEIELRIRNAQAKLQEAQAGEQQVRQLQLEIDAIRLRNTEVTNAQSAATGQGRAGNNANPHMVTASQNDAIASLVEKQTRGTLGADDLKTAQAAFDAANFNRNTMQQLSGKGIYSFDGIRSIETAYNQSRNILEAVQALVKKQDGGSPGSPKAAGTKTVNINVNGKNTPVNVSSDGDAQNLTAVMRQLESLSGRSNT